jgi:hypothetical protein
LQLQPPRYAFSPKPTFLSPEPSLQSPQIDFFRRLKPHPSEAETESVVPWSTFSL